MWRERNRGSFENEGCALFQVEWFAGEWLVFFFCLCWSILYSLHVLGLRAPWTPFFLLSTLNGQYRYGFTQWNLQSEVSCCLISNWTVHFWVCLMSILLTLMLAMWSDSYTRDINSVLPLNLIFFYIYASPKELVPLFLHSRLEVSHQLINCSSLDVFLVLCISSEGRLNFSCFSCTCLVDSVHKLVSMLLLPQMRTVAQATIFKQCFHVFTLQRFFW